MIFGNNATYRILDLDMMRILESTHRVGKSANRIMYELNIPQSTAYRKIRNLVEMRLLSIHYEIGKSGRWENRYKNNLSHDRSPKPSNFQDWLMAQCPHGDSILVALKDAQCNLDVPGAKTCGLSSLRF